MARVRFDQAPPTSSSGQTADGATPSRPRRMPRDRRTDTMALPLPSRWGFGERLSYGTYTLYARSLRPLFSKPRTDAQRIIDFLVEKAIVVRPAARANDSLSYVMDKATSHRSLLTLDIQRRFRFLRLAQILAISNTISATHRQLGPDKILTQTQLINLIERALA